MACGATLLLFFWFHCLCSLPLCSCVWNEWTQLRETILSIRYFSRNQRSSWSQRLSPLTLLVYCLSDGNIKISSELGVYKFSKIEAKRQLALSKMAKRVSVQNLYIADTYNFRQYFDHVYNGGGGDGLKYIIGF